jgi:hypothetical protein
MKGKDPRDMTVLEHGEFAAKVRAPAIYSKEFKRTIEAMDIASLYLEDSRALGRLLCRAKDEVELEAPPDGMAEFVEFGPPDPERRSWFDSVKKPGQRRGFSVHALQTDQLSARIQPIGYGRREVQTGR